MGEAITGHCKQELHHHKHEHLVAMGSLPGDTPGFMWQRHGVGVDGGHCGGYERVYLCVCVFYSGDGGGCR